MARLSLAQQLAQLEDTAPVDFDPEALNPHGAEDERREVDLVAAREHYMEVGPSTLRKLQDSVADPKYEGVRTSRKTLLEQDDHSDENEDGNEGSEGSDIEEDEGSSEEEFHGFHDGAEAEGPWSDEEETEAEEAPIRVSKPTTTSDARPPKRTAPDEIESSGDLTSTLKTAREADRRKGKAVARQIAFWDGLLDSRIRLQKAVLAANRLPEPSAAKSYQDDPECTEALLKLSEEALKLADDLFQLQERLLSASNVTPPLRKRQKMNDERSLLSAADDLVASSEAAAVYEQAYHPQLVLTLARWSSKIQAVAPSVLLPSNKGTFSKGKQDLKSAVQLVDETLLGHAKLLSRTQLRRTPATRIGNEVAEESEVQEEVELFDDTDFYQKMLRAIIDSRDSKDGGGDWLATQKQKKAKKNVDTKASKGRKLRYDVHEKIQNFMVPVPMVGTWHEEQIDELFSSLLGKGFENVDGDGMEVENQPIDAGFRVFG